MRRLRSVRAAICAAVGVAALGAAFVASCASPGVPPGGPPDQTPPQLVRITPDSNATNVRPREIELEFNEVVAEVPTGQNVASSVVATASGGGGGATGSPTLASIMILSPRAGALSTDWHRDRVVIHVRNGFRANTTYRLTILPGLADLRQNVRDSAIVSVFSTGPEIAHAHVSGIVFDWVAGRPAARALVEAITPDSVVYVTLADSSGRFTLANLPQAAYRIRGVIDANNNRTFDPREAFDTVEAPALVTAVADTGGVELLAFVHDTLGPRLATVTPRDSVTLRLTFDRPLDPTQPIEPTRFRVVARDSTEVPIASATTALLFDSLVARRQRAAADSAARADTSTAARTARARRDSTARRDSLRRDSVARRDSIAGRKPPPRPRTPSRPSPTTDVVIVTAQPLRPNAQYRVSVRGQRSVSGVTQPLSDRTITTPKPEPVDTTARRKAPGDTARRVPPDTARRRPGT